MKFGVLGLLCGETDRLGRLKSLVIRDEQGEIVRLGKNHIWDDLKDMIGQEVEVSGSIYFSDKREKILNARQFKIAN